MNKIPESLEKAFLLNIESEIISNSRIMCVLGAMLYAAFILADMYSVSAPLSEILLVRGAATIVFMSAFVATYHKHFIKYYVPIIFLVYMTAAAGIEGIIYIALPEDLASKVYFAGLLLVIMSMFVWSFVKTKTSMVSTSLIIISYVYIGLEKELIITELLVNSSLILSAGMIGFVSQVIRNKHLRENFMLSQSLEKAYKEKEEEAKGNAFLANHDGLTGLPNRRYLIALLKEALITAKDENKILAILFLDLNGFKQVNDSYGHAFGDEVLKIVAQRLVDIIPLEGYLSRLGGDEYIVSLLLDENEFEEINLLSIRISDAVSLPMIMQGEKINVGTSIGVSSYPEDGDTIDILMKCADEKMYQNKTFTKDIKTIKMGSTFF